MSALANIEAPQSYHIGWRANTLKRSHAAIHAHRPTVHRDLAPQILEKQHEAAELLVDRITRTKDGTVITYMPYVDHVQGAEGPYAICSQYASVVMGNQEAWFEVVRPATDREIRSIDFLAAPRLDFILGNTQSDEAARFADMIEKPQPGHVMVRLIEQAENPLITEYTRMTDPQKLLIAGKQLTAHLTKSQPNKEVSTRTPTPEHVTAFLQNEREFTPLYTAQNGITIGEGRALSVHLHRTDATPTTLFTYPTRGEDGSTATLITTRHIDFDTKATTAQGRIDWFCGCEKHGTKAEGHSCAHELLGALQSAAENPDTLTLIAWGGQDAKGRGSLSHSLKEGNLERLAQISEHTGVRRRPITVPSHLKDFPYDEQRPFHQLAAAFGAGLEAFGVTTVTVETGNEGKKAAIQRETAKLQEAGLPMTVRFIDGAEHHVPDRIHQRDVATRRKKDPKTYRA